MAHYDFYTDHLAGPHSLSIAKCRQVECPLVFGCIHWTCSFNVIHVSSKLSM